MDKKANLSGEQSQNVTLIPGGPGSQINEQVQRLEQDNKSLTPSVPKKTTTAITTPTTGQVNQLNKLAFMAGYVAKTANVPVQNYLQNNPHSIGQGSFGSTPALKAPDPGLQQAAGVGEAKSAKPFSGVQSSKKRTPNLDGASTMNSSTGMGISATQRNKI
jgi:hypothetical protein